MLFRFDSPNAPLAPLGHKGGGGGGGGMNERLYIYGHTLHVQFKQVTETQSLELGTSQ